MYKSYYGLYKGYYGMHVGYYGMRECYCGMLVYSEMWLVIILGKAL